MLNGGRGWGLGAGGWRPGWVTGLGVVRVSRFAMRAGGLVWRGGPEGLALRLAAGAGVGGFGLLWEKGIIPDCELATPAAELDSSLRSE